MAKVEIIFTPSAIARVKEGAKLIGKHELPDNFVGPVFEDVEAFGPSAIAGMVMITVPAKGDLPKATYLYHSSDISRIKIVP
jgi:hypothetical protein